MTNPRDYYKSGWIGGIFLLALNLLAFVPGLEFMEWVTQIISLPVFFFVARSAAERRYHTQETEPDPLEGVRSSGFGAVTISLTISIASMIIIQVIGSMTSGYGLAGPATLCWKVPLQIVLALAMGFLSNLMVINNYKQG